MSHIRERLGKNTIKFRQQKGWTQAHLAEKVEISPTFMMHIEHGTRGASLETVELLANALDVDISELFLDNDSTIQFHGNQRISRFQVENMLIDDTRRAILNCVEKIVKQETEDML
jgi:transcriptional regulator with XRE-family HTH domain